MLKKVLQTALLISLLFALILFYGWKLFKIDDEIKNILTAKLQSVVGQHSSIDEVSIGLGSFRLQGVQLAFQDAPYKFSVQELRLRYSIQSLFKEGFNLERITDEITILNPKLILLYNPNKNIKPKIDLSLELSNNMSEDVENLLNFLKNEYDFIKRITISEGEIVFLDLTTSKETRIAQEINGWAYTRDKGKAWVRLAGHIFETEEYNLILYGQLNLNRGGFDFLNVDLHDYQIGKEIPFLIPNYFEVFDGLVNGHIVITERLEPTRGFNIAGNISLRDGRLKIIKENLYFDDIKLDAEIKDWNLIIKNASQKINGSPTKLEGQINDLLDPKFELRLTSNQLDVGTFLAQFLPDKSLPFSGISTFDVLISQSLSNPLIQGSLKADSLRILTKHFSDIKVDLNFKDLSLNFQNISARIDDVHFSGLGSLEFSSPDKLIDFDLDGFGDFTKNLQSFGLASTDQCQGNIKLNVFGTLNDPVSRGSFDLVCRKENEEPLMLDGTFGYRQKGFNLNATSNKYGFHLTASIEDVFSSPSLKIDATNFETVLVFINDPIFDFLKIQYNLNLKARSNNGELNVEIDGYRRDNYDKLFHIVTNSQLDQNNNFKGAITLFPNSKDNIQGNFELNISQDRIHLSSFDLGGWLNGSFEISKKNYSPMSCKLIASGIPLSSLLYLLGDSSPNFNGNLYGQILLEDKEENPKFLGNLWLMDGFVGKIGPLKGEINFQADSEKIEIRKLSVVKLDAPYFNANGNYNFATKEIEATLVGSNLDVNEILQILTNSEEVAQGEAFMQVFLKGKTPKIGVYGDIRVHNAKILMFEFDDCIFEFGKEGQGNGSYLSDEVIHIGHVVLTKNGEFVVQGSAVLPHRNSNFLDVQLSGDGNFLSLLSDVEEFFISSKSDGHLDLHITGKYEKPVLTGSRFKFTNGYLKLGAVANKIKHLQGDLEIIQNDYFLDIKKLSGTIKEERVSISNTNNVVGLNHGVYVPLRVAGDDLNLGALYLETSSTGVPLNIPSLMDQGEIGWFSLVGRTSKEKFFVTGPWQRPNVRGEVQIRNANLMFPFAESSDNDNTLVRNILNNINWDVRTVSVKDTRYVRQFPAGIYVNMEVDKKSSDLKFTGVLKDSTFIIEGKVESTRGAIEYFDLNFRVEKFGAEFDRTSLEPIVYGKAWTVVRDSSNAPKDVYMTLYTLDDLTHQEVSRGRWDRIKIKLSSEYPKYEESQREIMATLGYSSDTMDDRARKAVGSSTDNLIFRPLLRPIERQLERKLGLDVVRFSYAITRNFLDANFSNEQLSSSLAFLRSTRLVLGKYLTGDVYFLYTGELEAGIDYQFQDKGVGLHHVLGLEYRLNPQWLLQMEYDYNTLLETHKDDKKIWLRHSFPF